MNFLDLGLKIPVSAVRFCPSAPYKKLQSFALELFVFEVCKIRVLDNIY